MAHPLVELKKKTDLRFLVVGLETGCQAGCELAAAAGGMSSAMGIRSRISAAVLERTINLVFWKFGFRVLGSLRFHGMETDG